MSGSGETHSTPVSEDRPVAEGQESDVPSTATMHSKPSVPVTVPPEPCLEPRPPVDGAPDASEVKPQPAQKPKEQSPAQAPTSRPGVPGHIHGTIGTGGDKISPLPQSQFRQPGIPGPRIQSFQPGGPGGPKKSVEQMEEAKLRSKYGKLNKPGGSDFLRMRLNKGGQKYFDSGDYNMAKSKGQGKIGLRAAPIVTKPGLPRPVEVTTGDTIPTPASIHHRKSSTEISKLAV